MTTDWNRLEWTGTTTTLAGSASGEKSPHPLVAVFQLINNLDNRRSTVYKFTQNLRNYVAHNTLNLLFPLHPLPKIGDVLSIHEIQNKQIGINSTEISVGNCCGYEHYYCAHATFFVDKKQTSSNIPNLKNSESSEKAAIFIL